MNAGEKKSKIIEKLVELTKKYGKFSFKPSKLDPRTKIYIRKIKVDKEIVPGSTTKFITISGMDKELKTSGVSDLRVNNQNRDGMWTSIFINELGTKYLSPLLEVVEKKIEGKK